MSQTPNKKDRLTLEQYLQAYKFRKKLSERSRSRSKNKQSAFQNDQQLRMQNVFQLMNNFLVELKLDFSQKLQQNLAKEKLFTHVSALLDKFMLKLKEQIKKMYKDVLTQYMVEHEKSVKEPEVLTKTYFLQKVNQAEEDLKKSKPVEVTKEKFKADDKQKKILEGMMNIGEKETQIEEKTVTKSVKEPSFMEALLGISKTQGEPGKDSSNNQEQNEKGSKGKSPNLAIPQINSVMRSANIQTNRQKGRITRSKQKK